MEGVARSMEPVRGRRVSPLRANLSAFFGGRSAPPIVQGEPFHIIYASPAVPLGRLTTAIEGTVVPVVEYVHELAQAEQRLEQRVINQLLGSSTACTSRQGRCSLVARSISWGTSITSGASCLSTCK